MSIETSDPSVVVTGATSGIGLATARALVARGFFVIGVGRSPERCVRAEREVREALPDGKVRYLVADLSLQRVVADLAQKIRALLTESRQRCLNVLVNNAATVSSWHTTTGEGSETQFAVNHLAAFRLTIELMPLLENAPAGRIITVTSGSHRNARIWWNDLHLRRRYSLLRAYGQSKLANVMFTRELNRKLGPASTVHAFAADPGLVDTELGSKGTHGLERLVWSLRRGHGTTAEVASTTIVHLATASIDALRGDCYWKDSRPVRSSRRSYDVEAARRLWRLSEGICGVRWNGGEAPA